MPSFEVHAGQAPQPWPAWTFLAMSICCSRVAWWATGAYLPPPKPSQVDLVNCRPPEKPLPVLIAQLPPDSHCASESHTLPEATAWLGTDAELKPRTFATLWAETHAQMGRHPDAESAVRMIRLMRRRESLRVALADTAGLIDVQQVVAALTDTGAPSSAAG